MRKLLQFLLPLLVLAVGVGTFVLFVKTRPKAQKKPREDLGVLVEIAPVSASTHAVVVHAQGTVTAARQIVLQPEVGGRILWRSDNLVPGGLVSGGETLVRLDAKNYQLALRQQQAQVNRAELDLQVEASRKEIAEREWQLLSKQGSSGAEAPNPLAVRAPQLKTAEVSVDAAKSALDSAKLNVSRTTLTAPFNAFVQRAQADRGQLVAPGSAVATLIGVDQFWVQISMPIENLAWIRVPGINVRAGEGAEARVYQDVGGQRVTRKGRVVRLLGDLDPAGRMARVLIEIDDPFNLSQKGERGLPLLLGAFVNVEIEGGKLEDVIEIPRTALRDGNRVFVLDSDSRLAIKDVTVVWRTPESVLTSQGLKNGDQLITSRLSTSVPGTLLRLGTKRKPSVEGEPVLERQ